MYHVYLLRSVNHPSAIYTGYTTNMKQRLADHNRGKSIYSSNYKPWQLEICVTFMEKEKAVAFEKYLKSSSGRAFAKKHF
ncbi:GIY-YIG nuclease family protein [Candidatus Babeliales bacterium]|nr:GIY-YIG nuclease family protein [Candidatus Babeliales bacterium]